MKRTPVTLHIDELIVHGLPHLDQAQLGDAVRRELGRLLAEHGPAMPIAGPVRVGSMSAGSIGATPGMGVDAVGARVAQAVHAGIRK